MSTVLARSAAVLQAADKAEAKITRELSLAEQAPIFAWLEETWDCLFSAHYPNDPYGRSGVPHDLVVFTGVGGEEGTELYRAIDSWIVTVYAPPRDSAWGFSGIVRYLLDSFSFDEVHDEQDCMICQKSSTNWPWGSNAFFTWSAAHAKATEPVGVVEQMLNAQSLVGGRRG